MKYGKFIDAEKALSFQLSFLSKAVSNDPAKYFMNCIHIEPSDKGEGLLGVATDGRRLHLVDPINDVTVKILGLTQGYWKVFKDSGPRRLWAARLEDSETKEFQYPNWRKAIPSGESKYETNFDGFSTKGSGLNKNHIGLAKFIHNFPEVTALNLKFIQDLGAGFDWRVNWYGSGKSLKFTEGDRTAVIMPMTID